MNYMWFYYLLSCGPQSCGICRAYDRTPPNIINSLVIASWRCGCGYQSQTILASVLEILSIAQTETQRAHTFHPPRRHLRYFYFLCWGWKLGSWAWGAFSTDLLLGLLHRPPWHRLNRAHTAWPVVTRWLSETLDPLLLQRLLNCSFKLSPFAPPSSSDKPLPGLISCPNWASMPRASCPHSFASSALSTFPLRLCRPSQRGTLDSQKWISEPPCSIRRLRDYFAGLRSSAPPIMTLPKRQISMNF